MKKRGTAVMAVIGLAVIALLFGVSYGDGKTVARDTNLTFNIVTTGDTAQVSKLTPTLAIMGFAYIDSFSYQPDTTVHQTITWTSPMQIMTFTLAGNTGDLLVLDTVGIGVVGCTISFASQDLGMEYDLSTGADSTIATAIDSIVDIFNKVTNLTDSVDAQDSGTYIKFVSLIGEGALTEPWTMLMTTDSTDTASAVDSVTIAMICDSMVAAINADAGLDSFLTAYDSTTFYITQSDDAGVLYYHTFLNHADTHGTLAASQANVTSNSIVNDTFLLQANFGATWKYSGVYMTAILDSTTTTAKQGIGLSDSAYIYLLGARQHGLNMEYFIIKGDSANSMPCTLRAVVEANSAGDTLLKEFLYIQYVITDSASDTTAAVLHPLKLNYQLIEK